MDLYIGPQIVLAEPCRYGGTAGYVVNFPDETGKDWVEADVFESEYRLATEDEGMLARIWVAEEDH